MSIDDACKGDPRPLALRGFHQEIIVLGKEHSPKRGRPVQQLRVFEPMRAVLEGGQNVDSSEPQAIPNRAPDVVIEVEAERQSEDPSEPQPLDQRRLPQLAAQALGKLGTLLQVSVDLLSMVPVVGQGGVDLTE